MVSAFIQSRVSNDRGYYNSLKIFLISHFSSNLHQTVPKESFQTIKSYSDLQASSLVQECQKDRLEFHQNQNSSHGLTCIYTYASLGKCQDELLETHKFLALKCSYSDEFLLPAKNSRQNSFSLE